MSWGSTARVAAALAAAIGFTACSSPSEPPPPSPGPPTSRAPAVDGQGADGLGDPYYPGDGNGGYDVTAYEVSVSYDPSTKHLDGDTTVRATATTALSRFNLDLTGLEVSAVEVDGAGAKFEREGEHELVVTPAAPLATGAAFAVRVRYAGEPEQQLSTALGDVGWQITKSGGAFVAGEPHSAAFWFPVNDHPRDKALFTLKARVPDGWSVVSNGREQPPVAEGGWTTYTWAESKPMASYLATIGVDRWTFERSELPGGIPVVNAYAPGAEDKKAVQARLPEVIAFLSEKFGPYPMDAAGGIYLNESIGFSLETQSRPIYAKWAELTVVVHENAHQWFGDSVSIDNWSDICLNECFASYSQWMWDEAKEGVDLDGRFRTEVARSTNGFWKRKLYDMGPGNEFTAVYDKGQLALHALRRQIGDPAWDRLLLEWTSKHAHSNASWPEFEEMVASVSGQDLRPFLDAWFRSAEQPADEFLYPGSLRR